MYTGSPKYPQFTPKNTLIQCSVCYALVPKGTENSHVCSGTMPLGPYFNKPYIGDPPGWLRLGNYPNEYTVLC